jgi:hypothetical protein
MDKTFLDYTVEGGTEKGIQIRSTDPVSPVENQVWINTTETALKYYKSGTKYILTQWAIPPVTVAAGSVDANSGNIFYKAITADQTFTFDNFAVGMEWTLIVYNNSSSNKTLTFPANTRLNDSVSDAVLLPYTTTLFKFVYINDIYCTAIRGF